MAASLTPAASVTSRTEAPKNPRSANWASATSRMCWRTRSPTVSGAEAWGSSIGFREGGTIVSSGRSALQRTRPSMGSRPQPLEAHRRQVRRHAKRRPGLRLHILYARVGRDLAENEPVLPNVDRCKLRDDAVHGTPCRERKSAVAEDLGRAIPCGMLHD